jgi:uncharacterized protein YgbK (DUF1537 family)
MSWEVEILKQGLQDEAPIFFVLTNTRAMSPDRAAAVTREVCLNLKIALQQTNTQDFLIVSRSDSTLRGHYPIETDGIAEELGSFDAHFLTPAFFEGGRITKDSIHYVVSNGQATPAHETEFAKDSVFAYSHSYLPDYVEEKTAGAIAADQVQRLLLADLRAGCQQKLASFTDNVCVAVDGENQGDLDQFAQDVLAQASQGKKFLFRSAASLLTSLAALGAQPIAAEEMAKYKPSDRPGVVLVGSHVQKTTEQLQELLQEKNVVGIEVNVPYLRDQPENKDILKQEIISQVNQTFAIGKTPVIYTSRGELTFDDIQERLDFGVTVSTFLMDLVHNLPQDLGFLISKGGITSNDVLSTGLSLKSVRLLGQIIPGCSVVRTEPTHPLFPNLPVVLFPGNVGDRDGLLTAYRRLA